MSRTEVVLLLGGNMGDPLKELDQAEAAISEGIGKVVSRSRDHWSEAWGFTDDRLFLNRCLIVAATQEAHEVLTVALEIEHAMGRKRGSGNTPGPRTIDIDILAIGDRVIEGKDLVVPHPRLHLRRFALGPMSDVCPSWVHPKLGVAALELLDRIPS